jgi:hypothetical protein
MKSAVIFRHDMQVVHKASGKNQYFCVLSVRQKGYDYPYVSSCYVAVSVYDKNKLGKNVLHVPDENARDETFL